VTTDEQLRLAESWLTVQRNWWASDSIDRLCHEAPLDAWPIILRMVELADDDELLESIGAGPLEDLLEKHAVIFLDDIESRVARDARFRKALSSVWLSERQSAVAKRLLELGCQFRGTEA
jgi:hypothetical protein